MSVTDPSHPAMCACGTCRYGEALAKRGLLQHPAADHPSTPVSGEVTPELCAIGTYLGRCTLPAGHDGRHSPFAVPASPSRETTQREEWVVVIGDGTWWAETSVFRPEAFGPDAERRAREHFAVASSEPAGLRYRLIHRVITSTVIEGASE